MTLTTRPVDTATTPLLLTSNGGSSSIRFAVYEAGDTLRRRFDGKIDRLGTSDATFAVSDPPCRARHAARAA